MNKSSRNVKTSRNKRSIFEEIINWLKTHNGIMPRSGIVKNGNFLQVNDMTSQEIEEVNLYAKWRRCEERRIFEKYKDQSYESVPEEYREKIELLRKYIFSKTAYEELIEWLEKHNGKMPRSVIFVNGVRATINESTEEERKERNLYIRWSRCEEKRILDEYRDKKIEEIPEEYREKIEKLREYGLGKSTYQEIIEWLENNDRKMPRGIMYRNMMPLKVDELTEEEIEERNLYTRWTRSTEKKLLDICAGRPIEEVPEEHREKIEKLRSLGQMGKRKDDKIKIRMKKSVAKEVGNNKETRRELEEVEMEVQTTADFKGE